MLLNEHSGLHVANTPTSTPSSRRSAKP
jgi:hypothetical protein